MHEPAHQQDAPIKFTEKPPGSLNCRINEALDIQEIRVQEIRRLRSLAAGLIDDLHCLVERIRNRWNDPEGRFPKGKALGPQDSALVPDYRQARNPQGPKTLEGSQILATGSIRIRRRNRQQRGQIRWRRGSTTDVDPIGRQMRIAEPAIDTVLSGDAYRATVHGVIVRPISPLPSRGVR